MSNEDDLQWKMTSEYEKENISETTGQILLKFETLETWELGAMNFGKKQMGIILVWNLTFVFTYIKDRENFLPIPTYTQKYLQVPLNY